MEHKGSVDLVEYVKVDDLQKTVEILMRGIETCGLAITKLDSRVNSLERSLQMLAELIQVKQQ